MGVARRRPHTPLRMEPQTQVRILLADMTTMLASIINAALGDALEIEVAGSVGPGEDLIARIQLSHADVLMMQSPDPTNADHLLPLLRHCPALRVLALNGECGNGFVHELRLHSTRLADLSAAGLVAAVHGLAGPPQSDARPDATPCR